MFRTASKFALIALLVSASAVFAQTPGIVSSEISVSRERAEIKLELDNGEHITLATIAGAAIGKIPIASRFQRDDDGNDHLFTYAVSRGDGVDRAWRDLLNKAMDAETSELRDLLVGWTPPAGQAGAFKNAFTQALLDGKVSAAAAVAPGMNDSVGRLQNKIEQLQGELEDARGDAIENSRRNRGPDWLAPLRHVGRGLSDIFGTIVTYSVLFFLGFAVVMFGGRKYIEGVADVARRNTGRSFLVGLAGTFLLVPVFVLGIIALAISIVGIPALLVWIPLFPIAAVCAATLGFLSVAHAAGESWAEKRYYGSDWFSRANSYYFMATGLALLAALFLAAGVVKMAGPWLGGINGLLNFFGIVVTWAACTVGFGSVLITRAGSRLEGRATVTSSFDDTHV